MPYVDPEKRNARARERYAADPEKKLAQNRLTASRHRATDPEEARASFRAWYAANREYNRSRVRAYQAAHPEVKRAWRASHREENNARQRVWTATHPEQSRKKTLKWQAAHPDQMAALWHRKRLKRQAGSWGSHTAEELKNIRKEQRDRCLYCGKGLRGKGHFDHWWPVCQGGPDYAYNLQLLCPSCNSRKRSKNPYVFEVAIGYRKKLPKNWDTNPFTPALAV